MCNGLNVIGTNLGGTTDSEYRKRKVIKWLAKTRANTPDIEMARSHHDLQSFPTLQQDKGKK